jgi:hypothetical protein
MKGKEVFKVKQRWIKLLLSMTVIIVISSVILSVSITETASANSVKSNRTKANSAAENPVEVGKASQAENRNEKGKAVMIILDRIGLSELNQADTPNMDFLTETGAMGLMTVNTGGTRSQRDAYLTMGAGTRAIGSDKSPLAFEVNENYQGTTAGDLYLQITGAVPASDAVVNLGFAQAARNNMKRPYPVTIGALGNALRDAGFRAAVVGNCDTPYDYKRYLVSFLMDDQGIVPGGFVNRSSLTEDHTRPFGIRTDYGVLLEQANKLWSGTDLMAIQLGDTSRAEDFRYEATDAQTEQYKKTAIEEGDAFIGQLIKKLDFTKDLILIVTPLGPAKDLAENNRMTPVIAAGMGISKGLLTSASTKRPGVVTNLDIGASILSYFNIPHQVGQLGAGIHSVSSRTSPQELQSFNKKLTEIFNQRYFLLRSYVTAQVLLILASLAVVFFARRFLNYAKACLLFLMAVPVSYLLLTLYHQPSLAGSFLLSWLLAAALTGLLFLKKLNALTRIAVLCFAAAGLLIGDQLTGARLIQGSPLGYDVISGARFYGIGNEYMGILIGAVCTGAGILYELWGKKGKPVHAAVFFLFALTLLTMAHPGIGANVGGTIAAAAAFSVFAILMYKGRMKVKYFLPVGALIAVFITGIFLFDSMRAVDSQSHMGQTVSLIRENGLIELLYIAKRKIEMNIRLFRYTIWTRVFLLSMLSVILLIFRPIGIFRDIAERYPKVVKGIVAALIGCIAALLVNDSGIVAAGTSMIYIAPPVLLIVMDHLPQRKAVQYGMKP